MTRLLQIAVFALLLPIMAACSSPSAGELYEQGKQFRKENEPVEAMTCFIAATRVNSGEFDVKGRAFSNMATMCRIGEKHQTAYELYARSLEQFRLANNSLAEAYALNNMAWQQAVLVNKQSAVELIRSALDVCDDDAVRCKVLESYAAAYLYAGVYDSVLFYTQQASAPSAYFDILRAQAYTFLGNKDSAVLYAEKVLEQTDNPRYLDDAYFILANCDTAASASSVRAWASSRADIQRSLERNQPEWMEALQMADDALRPQEDLADSETWILSLSMFLALLVVTALIIVFHRRLQADSLELQCRALRKSANLREELCWNDYRRFAEVCNERLSNIVEKLEKKKLSEREIRICVLVLIGFSYAEIADILYRAENGIGKDKYLIAKHLGVRVRELQKTLQAIANDHA